ncbi:MAG TPA: glucose 1-dehydrogenase [Geminicoccaceae bacterium]|nr:glucose 1-dehydrogenase [Geminicoccaceae bacterium]
MMRELEGKVAIVTGGSRGIGRAVAARLAGAGAAVVVSARGAEALAAEVDAMRRDGAEVAGLAADVGGNAACERLVAFAAERYGGVDILVNNAGMGGFGSAERVEEERWREVLAVNLDGVLFMSKHAIPRMRQRGGGSIVNIGSVHSFATIGERIGYVTTKTAVLGLTRGMALNHGKDGIRVNAVCPGPILTPLLRKSWGLMFPERDADEVLAEQGSKLPLGRLGRPEDIAEAVLFLAGPRSAWITGTDLKVDGGLLSMLALMPPPPMPAS